MIYTGDCLDVLRTLPADSVDAIVTDPPYGLAFMGKRWDYDVPSEAIWRECLRVLKPGGHLLAFAGTRTQHRMAVRIEDAGFEIRDLIAWVYGSGFPKSLDVSKAIDKAAGAEREVVGIRKVSLSDLGQGSGWNALDTSSGQYNYTAPATPAARKWAGWGTALKPALEPITVARKPLIGTVAENVLAHGTGALNVDGCRVGNEVRYNAPAGNKAGGNSLNMSAVGMPQDAKGSTAAGRWPANLIHDGSEEVVGLLNDAARFFYCAKASAKDRDEGVAGVAGVGALRDNGRQSRPRKNTHPTVKPTDLMRYLCRLVTPPGGTVLDPFMGSGSTGKAAMLEGFDFIGIERDAEYVKIAEARIGAARRLL
jgi:site-specific DNA-methyltransferase (adenine-specific)